MLSAIIPLARLLRSTVESLLQAEAAVFLASAATDHRSVSAHTHNELPSTKGRRRCKLFLDINTASSVAALVDLLRGAGHCESLYDLSGERHIEGRLARNLSRRGLVNIRRAAQGMPVRLTMDGETLAEKREQDSGEALEGVE